METTKTTTRRIRNQEQKMLREQKEDKKEQSRALQKAMEAAIASDGAKIRSSMGQIADQGMTPIGKSKDRTAYAGTDAQREGHELALSAIRHQTSANRGFWKECADKLRAMTVDARAVFSTTLAEWLKEFRAMEKRRGVADGQEPTKEQVTAARQRVASASVNVSMLKTISDAWQAGASNAALAEFAGTDAVPYVQQYRFARAHLATVAAGRRKGRGADSFPVYLTKLLATAGKRPDADASLLAQMQALIPQQAATVPKDKLTREEFMGL